MAIILYWSGVLEFFHPSLVSVLFTGPSLLEKKISQTLTLVSVLFWEVSKPTFNYNSFHLNITLQRNPFITSSKIVSATHL